MIDIKARKRGKKRTVTVSGEMNIHHIDELKKAFMKSFDGVDEIGIKLDDVSDIDLSGLQLLCSFRRTVEGMKKKLIFESCLPEVLQRVVHDSGFAIEPCFQGKKCRYGGGRNV